ncbi:MAG TPA: hypothetical protein VLT60_04020 [Usitatibacter sp.]|nr:hypothetical protein [Usitatibacter sp.]HUL56138.1 hypothetical protein [Usitatibacter sp.]
MRYVALFLGLVLVVLGIASLVPEASIDGELFGLIPVSVGMAFVLIGGGTLGVMAGLAQPRELPHGHGSGGHDLREWLA